MSEEMLPTAPPPPPPPLPPPPSSSPASQFSPAPAAGAKGVRKSHLGLIAGGAVVLFLALRMFSGGSSSPGSAPDVSAPAVAASAPAATDNSAPAAPASGPISTDNIFADPNGAPAAQDSAPAAPNNTPVAAPYSPPVATASSGNPLIGSWTLVDTDKDYCGTHESFSKDSMNEVKGGAATTYKAIYLIKPGYVDVTRDGDMLHYGQWDETGTDEITLRINSIYVVASCKYHRD
jgi:hypothetical protein